MYLTINHALEVLKDARRRIGGDKCLVLSLTNSEIPDRTINNLVIIDGDGSPYVQVECWHPDLVGLKNL